MVEYGEDYGEYGDYEQAEGSFDGMGMGGISRDGNKGQFLIMTGGIYLNHINMCLLTTVGLSFEEICFGIIQI